LTGVFAEPVRDPLAALLEVRLRPDLVRAAHERAFDFEADFFGAASGFGNPTCASVVPMRNRFVPHTGHVPFVPGVPFAVYVASGLAIMRFVLHFTQYACKASLMPFPSADTILQRAAINNCLGGYRADAERLCGLLGRDPDGISSERR